MSDELFSTPVSKSPRLRWIERHNLTTKLDPDFQHGDEDEFGNELFRWYAWKHFGKVSPHPWEHPSEMFGGDTEDDALAAWARARGVRMWNEEGL